MAKLSRVVIKNIVKECLIEILEEGLSTASPSFLSESRKSARHINDIDGRPDRKRPSKKNITDDKIINQDFESNVNNVANSMTSDPVLSSILVDTAKTTLQEQQSIEQSGVAGSSLMHQSGGDEASQVMNNSDPTEVFSESASKWADLAFS